MCLNKVTLRICRYSLVDPRGFFCVEIVDDSPHSIRSVGICLSSLTTHTHISITHHKNIYQINFWQEKMPWGYGTAFAGVIESWKLSPGSKKVCFWNERTPGSEWLASPNDDFMTTAEPKLQTTINIHINISGGFKRVPKIESVAGISCHFIWV